MPLRHRAQLVRLLALPVFGAAAFVAQPALADSDARTCYISIDPHPCLQAADPIAACAAALKDDPYDMQTRLSLCGAHLLDESSDENKIDAYIVVQKGIELCAKDAYVCQRFKYAKSMIEEGDEGTLQERQISAQERCDYGRELCVSRLSSSLGIRGCDLALICDAEDPELHASKGQKLLKRNRPAEAIAAFRIAAEIDSGNAATKDLLLDAERKRAALVQECIGGDSLDKCNNALLAGEPDEFDVQYRRGQLLLAEDRGPAALQAFINAQNANSGDEQLARELLAILPPALDEMPDDADLRRARGLALAATGSGDESVVALREALRLRPDDDNIDALLKTARAERAGRVQRDCLAKKSVKRCAAIIVAGEPDEAQIRTHMAELLQDGNDLDAALAQAQSAAALQPGDAKIAALLSSIRAAQAPPAPAQAPEPEPEPEPAPIVAEAAATPPSSGLTEAQQPDAEPDSAPAATGAAAAPIIFSNAAQENGRTY